MEYIYQVIMTYDNAILHVIDVVVNHEIHMWIWLITLWLMPMVPWTGMRDVGADDPIRAERRRAGVSEYNWIRNDETPAGARVDESHTSKIHAGGLVIVNHNQVIESGVDLNPSDGAVHTERSYEVGGWTRKGSWNIRKIGRG